MMDEQPDQGAEVEPNSAVWGDFRSLIDYGTNGGHGPRVPAGDRGRIQAAPAKRSAS